MDGFPNFRFARSSAFPGSPVSALNGCAWGVFTRVGLKQFMCLVTSYNEI